MSNSTYNCSAIPLPSSLESIPDISGVGVLIGFISASYILLLVVLVYYFVTFNPTLDPFRGPEDQSTPCSRPNPFDQLVLRAARRLLGLRSPELRAHHTHGRLEAVFHKCIMSMADVQLVTGLAILIGGYAALPSGLSALHWEMVIYLAWFSCLTHQMALSFLHNYLVNNPTQRLWRLVAMFTLLVMLIVGLVPTSGFELLVNPAANAICFFDLHYTRQWGIINMLIPTLLLLFGYLIRVLRLYKVFTRCFADSLTNMVRRGILKSAICLQRVLGVQTLGQRITSNMIVSAHLILCIWTDITTSMASDVFWLIVSLGWGTKKVILLHRILNHSGSHQESTWDFGQIIPVLLIASPLIALMEHFLEKEHNHHAQGQGLTADPSSDHNQGAETKTLARSVEVDETPPTPPTDVIAIQDDPSITTPADSLARPAGSLPTWILDPLRFDEYYTTKAWMFWAPCFPLSGVAFTTYLLLAYNTSSGFILYTIASLLLVHGVVMQYYILLLSAVDAKWRGRSFWAGAAGPAYLIGSMALYPMSYFVWPLVWMYMVCGSVILFLIALVMRKVLPPW